MSEPKMKENDNSVVEFIENVENEKKRADAYALLKIFEEVTGFEAKMWGPSIIGFGRYHYKYASGREGKVIGGNQSEEKGLTAASNVTTSHYCCYKPIRKCSI